MMSGLVLDWVILYSVNQNEGKIAYQMSEIISKADYTLHHIKNHVAWKFENNKSLDPKTLAEPIKQWEFDYEMDKEYRQEILEDRYGQLASSNSEFYEKTGG